MTEEERMENTEDSALYDRLYAEVSGESPVSETKQHTEESGSENYGEASASGPEKPEPEPAEDVSGWAYEPGKESMESEPGTGHRENSPESEQKKYTNRFFSFFSREAKYSREQAVLSRIDDAHLMDYLALEQKRYESEQKLKDERGKRILSAFQLAVSLAAIVAVIGFLKDEPTVLVNILYIIGIVTAVWLWKMKK